MFLAVRDATCKRHACSGTNCGASRGEVAARCALRRKFKIQNQANLPGTLRLAYSRFGAQPAEGAHDCTELRASAAGGCGPHGPDGPIQTRDKPAAERTGLLSSSARMQPSARGRLRAAGRSATEFTDDHSAKIGGCGLPVAARPNLSVPTTLHFCNCGLPSLCDRTFRHPPHSILQLQAAGPDGPEQPRRHRRRRSRRKAPANEDRRRTTSDP